MTRSKSTPPALRCNCEERHDPKCPYINEEVIRRHMPPLVILPTIAKPGPGERLCFHCDQAWPAAQMTDGFCPRCIRACRQCGQPRPLGAFPWATEIGWQTPSDGRGLVCHYCLGTTDLIPPEVKLMGRQMQREGWF